MNYQAWQNLGEERLCADPACKSRQPGPDPSRVSPFSRQNGAICSELRATIRASLDLACAALYFLSAVFNRIGGLLDFGTFYMRRLGGLIRIVKSLPIMTPLSRPKVTPSVVTDLVLST